MENPKVPIFRELNADDDEPESTEIESLCMNCHSNGITRLLLTKIPFFKEVVVMSFMCNECGYQNNEIQGGGKIAEKGVKITLKVEDAKDLNRQIVKSDHTSVHIPDLDFEIPAKTQSGEITTVEGILERSIEALEQDQPLRKAEHPEVAEQLEEFLGKLRSLKGGSTPFTLTLVDISGNSFIQNLNAPHKDPNCSMSHFTRTKEQDHELGIFAKEEVEEGGDENLLHPVTAEEFQLEDLHGEVLQFQTNCSHCGSPCTTNMKLTNIPHFKEVVIMATVCDVCGYKTNEVKSGAGIEPQGVHIEVSVKGKQDLNRDLLKSETCRVNVPELDIDVGPSAISGRFTTVEGILVAMKEQLEDHLTRDSEDTECIDRLREFVKKFDDICNEKLPITLILDDAAGNSYIQSLNDDDTCDDALKMNHYTRTFEQNEELGLNDIKTEGYDES